MNEKIRWELLARYFSGECSPEERKTIELWIKADPKNSIEFDKLEKIWASREVQNKSWNAHEALKKVSERIGNISPERKPFIPMVKIMRYAAVFLIIAASAIIISRIFQDQPAPVITEVMVPNGTTKEVVFPDNSKAILDAGSYLTYSDGFGKKYREVNLEGEGYFEVTGNPDIPFVVHAGEAVIKVIGTKFNVSAWEPSHTVKVVVAEGKVSLRSGDDSEKRAVIIEINQMSILPEFGRPQKPQAVEVNMYLGWMNRVKEFDNVPLNEILHQLERWYDLTIRVEDESLLSVRVTINIPGQHSAKSYLNLIGSILNLHYEISGKNVIFSKRN